MSERLDLDDLERRAEAWKQHLKNEEPITPDDVLLIRKLTLQEKIMQRHTDESYKCTIALLKRDGNDYAAILIGRLWNAQKEIEALEQELEKLGRLPILTAPTPAMPEIGNVRGGFSTRGKWRHASPCD